MTIYHLNTPASQAKMAALIAGDIAKLKAQNRLTPTVKLILIGRIHEAQNAGVISTDASLPLLDKLGADFVRAHEADAELAMQGATFGEMDADEPEAAVA